MYTVKESARKAGKTLHRMWYFRGDWKQDYVRYCRKYQSYSYAQRYSYPQGLDWLLADDTGHIR